MKIKIAVILGIIFLLFTGCSEVPQEVKDNISKQSSSEYSGGEAEVGIKNDLEYDTIDNIFETINDVTSKSYSNLTFPNTFELNKPEEIGQMKFRQISDFNDNYLKVIKDFLGDDFDEQYIYWDERLAPPGPQYDDVTKMIHFGMGNNGFYFYDRNDIFSNIMNGIYTEIERIPLGLEYEDHSYTIQEGDMSINEAIKQAQTYVNQFKQYSKDVDLIPNEVVVYQNDIGNYLYMIYYIKSYKNVYFTNYMYQTNKVKEVFTMEFRSEIIIDSIGSPSTIRNSSGITQYIETIKPYDKIITFDCATKLVEKLLSSYKKYEVQFVNIEMKLKLEEQQEIYDPTNQTAGNIYTSRPCWVYYLDPTPNKEVYVTVDCETGAMDFINNNF